jgi:hypothetical protein
MKEGQVCECADPAVDGWLYVTVNGKEGYVPEEYLKRV